MKYKPQRLVKPQPIKLKSITKRSDIPADMLPIDVAEDNEPLLLHPDRRQIREEGLALIDSPCMSVISADLMRKRDYEHMRAHRDNLIMSGQASTRLSPLTPPLSVYEQGVYFLANQAQYADSPEDTEEASSH